MGGGQDVDFNEPLPPWASGRAHGDYTALGAVLPTRDGRNCGNATVVSSAMGSAVHRTWSLMTDAGNEMNLTLAEIEAWFWPPEWIRAAPNVRPASALIRALRRFAIVAVERPSYNMITTRWATRCLCCDIDWDIRDQPESAGERHRPGCVLVGSERDARS